MVKKIYLVSSIAVASIIGAAIIYYQFTKDPYICSKGQIEEVATKLDVIINSWDDANSLAASSSRISLTTPVSKLQDIQKEIRGLSVPNCAKPVIESLLEMTDTTIKSYLLFMQNESDSTVEKQISSAKAKQQFFITSYSLLKKEKSTKKTEVFKQITEDFKKDLEDINKQIKP